MFEIMYFGGIVSSTNDIAKGMAKAGAPEGNVVLADSQTSGRGRMGRSFFSPRGTGAYMSILLRPAFSAASTTLITTAAAVAVAKAIEKHSGKKAQIKWVNDIFVDGKKVCGILTEGEFLPDGKFDFAILGIGINLITPSGGFGEFSDIAGAVFDGIDFNKDKFIGDILKNFEDFYKNLEKKPHYSDYVSRDMLIGKELNVINCGEILYSAKALGINESFALVLEHDGKKELLSSGEVSVRAK